MTQGKKTWLPFNYFKYRFGKETSNDKTVYTNLFWYKITLSLGTY